MAQNTMKENSKSKITNLKQAPMPKIQNQNTECSSQNTGVSPHCPLFAAHFLLTTRHCPLTTGLEFGALNLFGIWGSEFVISIICITMLHLIDFFRALNIQC